MIARANRRRYLATALAGSLLAFGCTASASTSPPGCPLGQPASCVQTPSGGIGQELVAAAGPDTGTPWMVTDPNGLPMAWVNLYGLYSGGSNNGSGPGGLICVTNGLSKAVACLTPQGTLWLQPPGAAAPVALTARDIRYLHRLERLKIAG